MTSTPVVSPFQPEGAEGRFRSGRVRLPHEVNLKSLGLLHPRAAEFHTASLSRIDPVDILTYPVYSETYDLVAAHLGVNTDTLVLTPGSDPGLGMLLRAFPAVTRIVIHEPNFGGWPKFARIANRELDRVPPDPDSGMFRLSDLGDRLAAGPPAFVVVTQPHSYTGQVHSAAELADLAATVARHGSMLVLDTAYLAFTENGEDLVHGITGQQHVARVNTFSKCFGLSGARVAAMVLHPALANRLFDIDPEATLSGISLALLRAALRAPGLFTSIWAEIRELRDVLAGLVAAGLPGWRARPSGGNFVTFDVPTPAIARAATDHLGAYHYVVRDLSGLPGLPAAVRIGVSDETTVRDVVRRLTEWHRGQP